MKQEIKPTEQDTEKHDGTHSNILVIEKTESNGTSISPKNNYNDDYIYIYPSQRKALIQFLQQQEQSESQSDLMFKHQEPSQEPSEYLTAILQTAKENGHQEPTQAETEQAQAQASFNISKICREVLIC